MLLFLTKPAPFLSGAVVRHKAAMSLNVYTSNRMELLVETFAETLTSPADPFAPEIIVVQSKGLQRWLAMELAKRFGVWANCDYPFPNKCVRDLFRLVMREIPETSPFEPSLMLWRIMRLLPAQLESPVFESLRGYFAGENLDLKRYQLAGKIADTFDQYTLFRGDMLEEWERAGEPLAGGSLASPGGRDRQPPPCRVAKTLLSGPCAGRRGSSRFSVPDHGLRDFIFADVSS